MSWRALFCPRAVVLPPLRSPWQLNHFNFITFYQQQPIGFTYKLWLIDLFGPFIFTIVNSKKRPATLLQHLFYIKLILMISGSQKEVHCSNWPTGSRFINLLKIHKNFQCCVFRCLLFSNYSFKTTFLK